MGRGIVAVLVGLVFATASAQAQSVDDTCGSLSPSAAACIGLDKLADAAAAECRRIGLPAARCALPLGHRVGGKISARYRRTWLHRAAAFQYRLPPPLPLLRASWLGTHNSFNSVNDSPTISHTDSNQQLSLSQQLDIDVRALELDVNYLPARGVVVGHGRGPDGAHFGGTDEPRLSEVLPEIASWLHAHPDEVL